MRKINLNKLMTVAGVIVVGFIVFSMFCPLPAIVLNIWLRYAVRGDNASVEHIAGSVWGVSTYTNVALIDVHGLPKTSTIKAQTVRIGIYGLTWAGVGCDVENGRLFLPESDVVQFDGGVHGGVYDLSLYAPSMSLRELLRLSGNQRLAEHMQGVVSGCDFQLTGKLFSPRIAGVCTIEKARYFSLALNDTAMTIDLTSNLWGAGSVAGTVTINNGDVFLKNNTISLLPGTITLQGNSSDPILALAGTTTVENVSIRCRIQGSLDEPDVSLTSSPPYDELRLMLMMLTGKTWQQTESAFSSGEVTPAIASDFVDYLLLGGTGDVLRDKLGIESVSLVYTEREKGIAVEKKVISNTYVGYGVSQRTNEEQDAYVAHTVGARVNVTDAVSVNAEKTMVGADQGRKKDGADGEEKVMLTFTKSF